jgi:hypothetical protein
VTPAGVGWDAARRADSAASTFLARWTALLDGECARFGGAMALAVPGQPDVEWMQTVVGLTPADADEVPAIVEWYRQRGASPRFEVLPADEFEPLARSLMAVGARPAGFVDVLVGPPPSVVPEPTGVEIRRVGEGADEASTFARLLLGGHEVPADADPINYTAVERWTVEPGWRGYVASVEGRPVGTALLALCDGVAYLANAATLPEGRRRGAHSALIARRLNDANEAGCELVCSSAQPWSGSRRNLERAGLRVAATKTQWVVKAG